MYCTVYLIWWAKGHGLDAKVRAAVIRTAADADGGAAAVPGDVGDVAVVGVVVVHVVTVQGDDEAVLGSFSSCFEKVARGQVTANFIFFYATTVAI